MIDRPRISATKGASTIKEIALDSCTGLSKSDWNFVLTLNFVKN